MSFITILKKQWKLLVTATIVVGVLIFIFSAIEPPKYKTSSTILIIQNQGGSIDSYTASKSAEQLGNVFTKVIHTSSFMESVLKSSFDVKDVFGADQLSRKKVWDKSVEPIMVNDTGLLEINVYADNKEQSGLLAQAVNGVLTTRGQYYHGGGADIRIKVVDDPITFDKPAEPRVLVNTIFGSILTFAALAGVLLVLGVEDEINPFEIFGWKKSLAEARPVEDIFKKGVFAGLGKNQKNNISPILPEMNLFGQTTGTEETSKTKRTSKDGKTSFSSTNADQKIAGKTSVDEPFNEPNVKIEGLSSNIYKPEQSDDGADNTARNANPSITVAGSVSTHRAASGAAPASLGSVIVSEGEKVELGQSSDSAASANSEAVPDESKDDSYYEKAANWIQTGRIGG